MNEHDFWTQQQAALRQVHQETALHHGGRPPVVTGPLQPERRRLDPSRSGCQCGQGWNWDRWWADWLVASFAGLFVYLGMTILFQGDLIRAADTVSMQQVALGTQLDTLQEQLKLTRTAWWAAEAQLAETATAITTFQVQMDRILNLEPKLERVIGAMERMEKLSKRPRR